MEVKLEVKKSWLAQSVGRLDDRTIVERVGRRRGARD